VSASVPILDIWYVHIFVNLLIHVYI
jgi:hypothetical protein